MNKKIDIIAELGWNHMGDMDLAKDMIYASKEAGANYVKFQTWKVDRLTDGPWDTDGRREIYEQAELSEDNHYFLKDTCEAAGIKFLTSVFSHRDLAFIRQLTNEVKIPSPESGNIALVQDAIDMFDKIFISTGASYKKEYNLWAKEDKAILMHCTSAYPCDPKDFNIAKLNYIKAITNKFGYSGHQPIVWDAMVAISHGACVIEKHLTLDNNLPGRDNKFALLPDAFSQIRKFADHYNLMVKGQECSADILECEQQYRTFHKGRWDKREKTI